MNPINELEYPYGADIEYRFNTDPPERPSFNDQAESGQVSQTIDAIQRAGGIICHVVALGVNTRLARMENGAEL